MMTTPEQRAREVCARITMFADWRDREAIIARAIQEAENAAHEMGAEWCDEVSQKPLPVEFSGVVDEKTMHLIARNLAQHLRSFKNEDVA